MARGDGRTAIRVDGLAAYNRALRSVSKDMGRDSVKELKRIGEKVKTTAVPMVPRRTGKTAASLKVGATAKGARIYSLLPQSPVIEYGGTIHPRGVPIKFKRTRMVTNAIKKDAPHIEEDIAKLFDRTAHRHGFSTRR